MLQTYALHHCDKHVHIYSVYTYIYMYMYLRIVLVCVCVHFSYALVISFGGGAITLHPQAPLGDKATHCYDMQE